METINPNLDYKKEDNSNTLEGLRLQLHTRLEEQGKIGKVPLSGIAKELNTYPIVSFLYDDKIINPNDQPDREGIPMYTESKELKEMLGFIHDNQNIPEQKKSSYLTFEKKDGGMLVNLVKIEPSTGEGLVWVKKLTVKEFADFTHEYSQN